MMTALGQKIHYRIEGVRNEIGDRAVRMRSMEHLPLRRLGPPAGPVMLNAAVRDAFGTIRPSIADGPVFPRQARVLHGSRHPKPDGCARSSRHCRACSPALLGHSRPDGYDPRLRAAG